MYFTRIQTINIQMQTQNSQSSHVSSDQTYQQPIIHRQSSQMSSRLSRPSDTPTIRSCIISFKKAMCKLHWQGSIYLFFRFGEEACHIYRSPVNNNNKALGGWCPYLGQPHRKKEKKCYDQDSEKNRVPTAL